LNKYLPEHALTEDLVRLGKQAQLDARERDDGPTSS
jgi:hypothetical protein